MTDKINTGILNEPWFHRPRPAASQPRGDLPGAQASS